MDKKKLLIGTLCALIMIMAVGYALLAQTLSITGSASITSNWQIEITNIRELEKSTGTTTNSTNYTATTASFNTSLTSPGDYAIYEITVTNKGTLDAVLAAKPIVTSGNNEAIIYELEGIQKGDKILKNNQTDTFTIKVQYNSNTTSQPSIVTSDIEVTLNYQQDLGQVSPYDGYSIGDKVIFAGSNWYVIKNSTEDEDYVTLMKENVLTAEELGQNYVSSNKERTDNEMAYYWSSTCHDGNSYWKYKYGTDGPYNAYLYSGCDGHEDYANSKVKEFLEGTYINTLGASKLKEIDGYKIRLITTSELQNNLGWEDLTKYATTSDNSAVPKWVYQDIGEYSYWTMTPDADHSAYVWTVKNDGYITNNWFNDHTQRGITRSSAVRPVINLLKSSIE